MRFNKGYDYVAVLAKFFDLFNYKLLSGDVIGSQVVRHEAGMMWSALTMDGRQVPGEKNVGDQLSWY